LPDLKWAYSKAARKDIKAILDYSDTHWGTEQMRKYAREIDAAILMLCRHPQAGRADPMLPATHRLFPVGTHNIIYRRKTNAIWIVRVLHQNMDTCNRHGLVMKTLRL
jgi:toxin ParE1/3/4